MTGDARRPGAKEDRRGAQAAAGFQDAAQPLCGAGVGGGDQRGTRSLGAARRGGGLRVVAGVEGTGGAGVLQQDTHRL